LIGAVVLAAAVASTPVDRFPKAASSYLVAIDGRVAWAREPDRPRPPASLTKIMTALVLLEGIGIPTLW
jgi:D-alanyl-D-alanine carboxypeptidase (penicillin-binding protein 5/6)